MLTSNIGFAGDALYDLFTGHVRAGGGGGRFCAGLGLLFGLSVDEPAGCDPPEVSLGLVLAEVSLRLAPPEVSLGLSSPHFGSGGGAGFGFCFGRGGGSNITLLDSGG